MPKTKYVADWLARAEEDMSTAQFLFDKKGATNIICFHSQQAAEKYLKGFLAFHEKHVRKTHDLGSLVTECQQLESELSNITEDASCLSQFAVETRYPGDMPEFSRQDAQQAIEAASRIRDIILPKMEID